MGNAIIVYVVKPLLFHYLYLCLKTDFEYCILVRQSRNSRKTPMAFSQVYYEKKLT